MCGELNSSDIFVRVKEHNKNNGNGIGCFGIILDPGILNILIPLDDIAPNGSNVVKETLKKSCSWLEPRETIRIDKATKEYISKFNNNEKLGIELDISSDYIDLDVKLGELAILGGRPAIGKTLVATEDVLCKSTQNSDPILFLTLENPVSALAKRLLERLGCARIPWYAGRIADEDYTRLYVANLSI